jgi:uncharacterized protein (TIGR02996 family)
VTEPRGVSPEVRALQTRLAQEVIAALANRAPALPDDERAQIAAWIAHLPTPGEDRAERDDELALWDEVIANPDDLGARMVLADALIEQDDPRGQVIALQCNGSDERAVKAFLHEYWQLWLGDAALVFDRRYCTFERGMLAVATAGSSATPEWAYGKLAGNRELAAIRWLKRSNLIKSEPFLQVLDSLPRPPARLTIDVATMQAMRPRAPWSIREVELVYRRRHRTPSLDTALRQLSATFPGLAWLGITTPRAETAASCAIVPQLPMMFPRLAHVVLADRAWQWEGTRAECTVAPEPPA